jgi:hypothetical protein
MGNVPAWILRWVGVGLVGFIGLLLVAVRRARRPEPLCDVALSAIVLDLGWVLGTAALTPVAWTEFEPVGSTMFWGVGAVVLAIAIGQWFGISRLYAETLQGIPSLRSRSQGTFILPIPLSASLRRVVSSIRSLTTSMDAKPPPTTSAPSSMGKVGPP